MKDDRLLPSRDLRQGMCFYLHRRVCLIIGVTDHPSMKHDERKYCELTYYVIDDRGYGYCPRDRIIVARLWEESHVFSGWTLVSECLDLKVI